MEQKMASSVKIKPHKAIIVTICTCFLLINIIKNMPHETKPAGASPHFLPEVAKNSSPTFSNPGSRLRHSATTVLQGLMVID